MNQHVRADDTMESLGRKWKLLDSSGDQSQSRIVIAAKAEKLAIEVHSRIQPAVYTKNFMQVSHSAAGFEHSPAITFTQKVVVRLAQVGQITGRQPDAFDVVRPGDLPLNKGTHLQGPFQCL